MERYRNETAARKRKRRQARVRRMTAVLTIAVCAVVIFTGSRIVNARMNEPVTPEAVVLPTLMPGVTPEPQPTEIPAAGTQLTGDSAWMLMLVNKWHALPEGYEPPSLTELSNGESVDERMYPSLQQMFDDARDQGVYPLVGSGYRTAEEQQQTMDDKISYYKGQGHTDADARSLASQSVAEPGYSEHQTGLAVDINADDERSTSDEVYAWLAENCAQYGFILRYPDGKTDITGITYEPWHFRYVGVDAAKAIMDAGICLEEYLGVIN